jgi:hypothetical protein
MIYSLVPSEDRPRTLLVLVPNVFGHRVDAAFEKVVLHFALAVVILGATALLLGRATVSIALGV